MWKFTFEGKILYTNKLVLLNKLTPLHGMKLVYKLVGHDCFSWKWLVLARKCHTIQKINNNSVKTYDILTK